MWHFYENYVKKHILSFRIELLGIFFQTFFEVKGRNLSEYFSRIVRPANEDFYSTINWSNTRGLLKNIYSVIFKATCVNVYLYKDFLRSKMNISKDIKKPW